MGNLEKMKNEIEDYCKDRFEVFLCKTMPGKDEKNAIFAGSHKEFLKFAEKNNVKIIYLLSKTIEKEDLDLPFFKNINEEHIGKIAFIEAGFFINGVYHTFGEKADWFVIPEEVIENEDYPKEIEEKNEEQLIKEMIDYVQKEYPEVLKDTKSIYDAQDSFWSQKGIINKFSLEPKVKIKMKQIDEKVKRKIIEDIKKEELKILPKLITECIEWAEEQGFSKLKKTNLYAFLDGKGISLTFPSAESLFIQVNNKLKIKGLK